MIKINQKLFMQFFSFEQFSQFPTKTGIYYFYDDSNDLLYVGKAGNFRERMRKHMNENKDYSKYYELIKDLDEAKLSKLSDAEFDKYSWAETLYGGSIQPIDQDLHLVKKIGFIEKPKEQLYMIEKEKIAELQPPYNKESNSETWDFIQGRFWEIRNLMIKEHRKRNDWF